MGIWNWELPEANVLMLGPFLYYIRSPSLPIQLGTLPLWPRKFRMSPFPEFSELVFDKVVSKPTAS